MLRQIGQRIGHDRRLLVGVERIVDADHINIAGRFVLPPWPLVAE